MEQHPVPQQISAYQFRLVGDMTLKQFMELAAGGLVALLIYSSNLPAIAKWPLMIVFVILGIAFAFLPLEDRPLEKWMSAFFRSIYSPTLFFWAKTGSGDQYFQPESAPAPAIKVIAPQGQEKMKQYLNEHPAGSEPQPKKLNANEQGFLAKISSLFQFPAQTTGAPAPAPAVPQVERAAAPSPTAAPQAAPAPQPAPVQSTGNTPGPAPEPIQTPPAAPANTAPASPVTAPVTMARVIKPSQTVPAGPTQAAPLSNFGAYQTGGGQDLQIPETRPIQVARRIEPTQSVLMQTANPTEEQQTGTQSLYSTAQTPQIMNQSAGESTIPHPQNPYGRIVTEELESEPKPSAAPVMAPEKPDTLSGQVTDSEGKILEGAILEIKDEAGRPVRAVKTNKLGHFFIVTPLANGKYEIITEKDGYEFDTKHFDVNGTILPPIVIRAKNVLQN